VRQNHNPERYNRSVHSRNTGRQGHNLERASHSIHSNNRETMKEGKKRDRIESRITILKEEYHEREH
jgi:hypothetical protein